MGKFLRLIGILLLGLTAVFTILGGVGTTCVALAAENYDSMVTLAPYKWLYVLFVIGTIAAGVMMGRATLLLIQREPASYRNTITSLILGIGIGVIHMVVSRSLRGSSMPVDAVVDSAVVTLIVFLLYKIPGVWEKVDFEKAPENENEIAGGAASIASGLLAFTIQHLMAGTHTMNGGINYADAFHTTMTFTGWMLMLVGINMIAYALRRNKFLSSDILSNSPGG
jgi:hypothetical protein